MAFVPLTEEEKKKLRGERESPVPLGRDRRLEDMARKMITPSFERIMAERGGTPWGWEITAAGDSGQADTPAEIPPEPEFKGRATGPRYTAHKMITPSFEDEMAEREERINEGAGGGVIVNLTPREKALVVDEELRDPPSESTQFLARRFRDAYLYHDPQAYAEDVARSQATGIPFHMMYKNDDVRREADALQYTRNHLDGLKELHPNLVNWLQIPGRLEIARDDMATLAELGEIMKVEDYRKNTWEIVKGYRSGLASMELGKVGTKMIFGTATEEDLAWADKMREQAALNDRTQGSVSDKLVSGLGYMGGLRQEQFIAMGLGGLAGGAVGAGTAIVMGQLGPQAATPEEVLTVPAGFFRGFKYGSAAAAVAKGFEMEAGNAYWEYSEIRDEDGNPLPEELVRVGAIIYGAGASWLEGLQAARIAKVVPGLQRLLTKEAVSTLLKTQTFRQAVTGAMKEYAGDLTFEVLTEGVQQAWEIITGEFLKNEQNIRELGEALRTRAIDPHGLDWMLGFGEEQFGADAEDPGVEFSGKRGTFQPITPQEALEEVGREIYESIFTFALGMIPGSGMNLLADINAASRARSNQARFKALAGLTKDSMIHKAFSPAWKEAVNEMTKDGPIAEIGINAKVFSETLSQEGIDPVEVAARLGVEAKDLGEAVAVDSDIWVDTGTYAEQIAGTEMHGRLLSDLRVGGPEEMTVREAAEFSARKQEEFKVAVEEARKALEAAEAEHGPEVEAIRADIKAQLEGAGIKWMTSAAADSYAALYGAMAVQAAKRRGVTPKQWAEQVQLKIEQDKKGTRMTIAPKDGTLSAYGMAGVSREGGKFVSLDMLHPSHPADPGKLLAAKKNLAAAARGEIPLREPLRVWARGDGTYVIADGNHTYAALLEAGAFGVPVKEEPIRNQGVTSMENLYAAAQKAEPEFNGLVVELQGEVGGELSMHPEIKGADSINRKVFGPDGYEGDFSRVVDVLGGTLIFDTEQELLAAFEKLDKDARIVRRKLENWTHPTLDGYRDILLNIMTSGGYVAELQLHHRGIAEAKSWLGHELYKFAELADLEGDTELAQRIQGLSRYIYEQAFISGQGIPATLNASSLETLRDLRIHRQTVSWESRLRSPLDSILNALTPLEEASPSLEPSSPAPFSQESHLPSESVSITQALSSSESTKNSKNLTDITSTTIIPGSPQTINGKVSEVVTGNGMAIQTRFAVVDAGELVTSNTDTFAVNESYPQELQPRQRDRAAGLAQVENILSNLDPERLGESRLASDGAPIVGPDMVVESGNGRVMALRLAYNRGRATIEARSRYINWLKENAARFGLLREEIEGMDSPILVRVRESDVDRVRFAKEANVSSVAAMSRSEMARSDAAKMSGGTLALFDPGFAIGAAENRSFVREFLRKVVPANELGTVLLSGGVLSKDGIQRIQNALAARAFGDHRLLERMAESSNDSIRNISQGLLRASPSIAIMEDRIAGGRLRPEYTLAENLSSAVNLAAQIRERGDSVEEYLSQSVMFSDLEASDRVRSLLGILEEHKRAPTRIAWILNRYVELVEAQGSPDQESLFGEAPPSPGELLAEARASLSETLQQGEISPQLDADQTADTRYQKSGKRERGNITLPAEWGAAAVKISLTPRADRSTFLHEVGHLYLWDLEQLESSGKMDAATAQDLQVLRGWWSDKAGDLASWIRSQGILPKEKAGLLTDEAVRDALKGRGDADVVKAVRAARQEYFGRGFEQYLMEGRAPDIRLAGAFARFKQWLTTIYKALRAVPDVELSDEVRDVMDRMVASEEAIELSRLKRESDKAAREMLREGVPDVAAEQYRAAAEKAAVEAKSRLLRVLMGELREDYRKKVDDARYEAEARIRTELLKQPRYKVYDTLRRWLEGTGEKLDSSGLTEEQLSALPGELFDPAGSIDLGMMAERLALNSDVELIALLTEANAEPFDATVAEMAAKEVASLDSAANDEEFLRSQAEEAIMSSDKIRLLSLEREILAKKLKRLQGITLDDGRTMAAREKAMAEQARIMMQGRKVRDGVAAHRYMAEAKRAAREALNAALEGRFEDAMAAKEREMLNSFLFLEAKALQEEQEKRLRYLRKFWTGRDRLKPLVGEENLTQISAILARYGLQQAEDVERSPLGEWLQRANAELGADVAEQGVGLPVPDWMVRDDYRSEGRSWKDLTVQEFQELRDAVRGIEKFGRDRNRLVAQEKQQNMQKWVDRVRNNVEKIHGKLKPGTLDPNYEGAPGVSRYLASMDRIEFLLRRLDGFEDLGPAWELFFQPVTMAERLEIARMREAKGVIERIFSAYTPEERTEMRKPKYLTKQLDPATGKPLVLSKENVLAMLLNWGAKENREEVVFGYGFDRSVFNRGEGRIHYADINQYYHAFRQGVTEVEKLFAEVLTDRDYEVVQAVWDYNDSFWREVSTMVRDLTGVTPERVERVPVRSASGVVYEGGYYHLAFKPESNIKTYALSEREAMKALYEPQGIFAFTRRGHTKGRHHGQRGSRLLRLDLGVSVEHLRDVIHDLYFRPVVRDLNKLLGDPAIQNMLVSTLGFEGYRQFKPWVHGLANAYRPLENYGERAFQKMMGNTSAAILGWSMTSALSQLLGYFPVASVLGTRRTVGMILDFWSQPWKWAEKKEFAFSRSEYLRDRINSFDRDVKAAIDQVRSSPVRGKWAAVQETFFLGAGLLDMGVNLPTWLAAYDVGMTKFDGMEAKAIEYADWVVRGTQNTGAAKDLSNIQRGGPAWKAMTMFYTAFGSIYNQTREHWFRGHGAKDLPRIAAYLVAQYVMPAIIGDMLMRRGPDGDESPDEIWKWIFTSVLQYASSPLIGIRDIVNAATSGFDYRMSPAADAGQAIARLLHTSGKMASAILFDGEMPDAEKTAFQLVDVAGVAWGIPSKQIMRTARGVVGYLENSDWSPLDLILTKPKK